MYGTNIWKNKFRLNAKNVEKSGKSKHHCGGLTFVYAL
jgi:hypothetical protein